MPDISPEQISAIDDAIMDFLGALETPLPPELEAKIVSAQQILAGLQNAAQGPEYQQDSAGGPG